VVYIVEKAFDVKVNYPTVFKTVDSALLYGIMGRFVWAIPKRVSAELLIDYTFQFGCYHLLRYPVGYG
jgi:hypothetical protein